MLVFAILILIVIITKMKCTIIDLQIDNTLLKNENKRMKIQKGDK